MQNTSTCSNCSEELYSEVVGIDPRNGKVIDVAIMWFHTLTDSPFCSVMFPDDYAEPF